MVLFSLAALRYFSIFLLMLTLVSPNRPKQRMRLQVTNFLCNHDETKIKDVICVLKPARNAIGTFSFGYTIIGLLSEVWIILKAYDRNRAGLYQNERVIAKIDLCQVTRNQNMMVALVYNLVLKKFLEDTLQECPYKGRFEAVNKTIGSIDAFLDLNPNLPTGDYKYIFSYFDAEFGEKPYFEVQAFVHIKGKFLTGRG